MTSNNFTFPEVRIVQASAGSGKTHQLTKRYVQLLLKTYQYDQRALTQLLAITFTNKAASEMKARILEFLKKTALMQLKPWEYEDVLLPVGLTAQQAAVLAQQLMDYILREYHYFAVSTIDSFVNTLLAGCAFKIGLSAKFRIKRNAFDYLQLGLDELLVVASQRKDVHELFDAFVKQYLFLENRGGWLPKKDLLDVMVVLYRQVNTYGMPLLASAHHSEDLFKDKKRLYDTLSSIYQQAPEGMPKRFYESLGKFVIHAKEGFDIDQVSDYLAHEEFPALKNATIPPAIQDQWVEARRLLEDICLQEAFGVFDPYIHIHQSMMGFFSHLQQKDDVLFLEQLNHKASALFDDDLVTVGEIYFRLAARFRHYMIDEFQDTNPTQWRNIRLMVEEALSSDGSLFLVGDTKQAIYGFRGGDSTLFGKIKSRFAHLVHTQALETNYRSQRAIVEFNNKVFSLANIAQLLGVLRSKSDAHITLNDEENIKNVFEFSQQQVRKDQPFGVVRVTPVLGSTHQERDDVLKQMLLDQLLDVSKRFKWGDVAILVRSNTDVALVTGWLLEAKIAVQSERTSDIKEHPLVKEMLALLTFCYTPSDNLALATFLLGDIAPRAFNFDRRVLAAFCFKNRGQDLLYSFKQEFPKEWEEFFSPILSTMGQYPLYELMVSIYRHFKVQENFKDSLAFLVHLLEVIKLKEEDSVDVGAFLDAFEYLEDEYRYIPLLNINAVRVLTVHKAKGLEFPVVIVPFLEMNVKVGAGGKEGQQSFSVLLNESDISLVRLKKTYAKFCSPLKRLWDYEYNKALLNELCTLYVALTRAIWEMYIFVPEKSGNAFNHALSLLPQECWQCGDIHEVMPSRSDVVVAQLKPLALTDWMAYLRQEDQGDDGQAAAKRQRGERWHAILSQIITLGAQPIHSQLEQAIKQVIPKASVNEVEIAHDIKILEKFLCRSDVEPYFKEDAHERVINEMEVVNKWGDLNRIDKVIIRSNAIIVVDFKTSRLGEANHQAQLEEYCRIIQSVYPGKSVQGALLYIEELS